MLVVAAKELYVVAYRRGDEPEGGKWALPGGMVTYPSTPRDELHRHLKMKGPSLDERSVLAVTGTRPNRARELARANTKNFLAFFDAAPPPTPPPQDEKRIIRKGNFEVRWRTYQVEKVIKFKHGNFPRRTY